MAVAVASSLLAPLIGAELIGGGDPRVTGVASLEDAGCQSVAFFSAERYRQALHRTRAGVVILNPDVAEGYHGVCLVTDNPLLAFALVSRLLHPRPTPLPGVHPSTVVAPDAEIDPSASISAHCVVDACVRVGARVEIGPGCIIQAGAVIGCDSRLVAGVTLCAGTIVGERALLHPGAVIGREGFGFAKDGDKWVRIPQIGRVRLGDDVEIGSNSVVDRATIGETVIGNGVKIDNLVQIGHNVRIGENTAMAACSGISGSTRIGRNCTIAGAVGMAGHLLIADDVHLTGMAMVTRSIAQPGVYSSGIPASSNAVWRRNVARFRRLEELWRRVQRLERVFARRPSDTVSD
jgi:UDP-3-O-[3-hydroxymyristoyl] glucosamine N-acyltransferase